MSRRQATDHDGPCNLPEHRAVSVQERGLRGLCPQAALLPEHTESQDCLQLYEGARDVARTVCTTPAYEQSRKDRKKVEMLFAHLKRILKLDRLRLRGLNGARDEFLMAAAVQNLRRMAKWLAPKAENASLIPV
jgi:hypothetical protein